MNLCVIPARGGSKRIPRKNIKNFAGKPMIAWSIEQSIKCKCFDEIWVSTDDVEIADVAKNFGATVPFTRPPNLSDDYATTLDVMSHAIKHFELEHGFLPTYACCIYATAPFIDCQDLQTGLEIIKQDEADYVFAATNYVFPIQRAIRLKDDYVEMLNPELFAKRSQDLEEMWHDAGQFYWGTSKAWLDKKSVFSSYSKIVALPHYRVQDIDTLDDWQRAEMLHKVMYA